MQLNIAICDDEQIQIENTKKIVESWCNESKCRAQINEFTCSEQFLFTFEDNQNFDILLLDIEMGEISGVELAKKVRKYSDSVQIIFITGYSEYILDGYEVSALQYLMKPVNEEKLFSTLNRAVEKIKKNEEVLIIETSVGVIRVPLYQIVYIEVVKNYITIHAKENYTTKMTLSETAKKLDNSFLKIGRSFIINLNFISKVTKTDVHFVNGAFIPFPRGMYNTINRAIIDL